MAYLRCDFHSNRLGMQTSFIALLPETGVPAEAPVVYLLHGLTDNCTGWTRYTSVERYARERGAAVIMPEVQRSFYTDMAQGPQYLRFVREELPRFCQRTFGLSAAREKNYVMGLSMGGYGALKCVLTAPQQYAGCAAFSSVTDVAARNRQAHLLSDGEFAATFGRPGRLSERDDLFILAEDADVAALPPIYMTCGEQDQLFMDNRRFAAALSARGAEITFEHWPGEHSWALWDRSIEQAMKGFLR